MEIGNRVAALDRLIEIKSVVKPRALALLEEMDILGTRSRELKALLARADRRRLVFCSTSYA